MEIQQSRFQGAGLAAERCRAFAVPIRKAQFESMGRRAGRAQLASPKLQELG